MAGISNRKKNILKLVVILIAAACVFYFIDGGEYYNYLKLQMSPSQNKFEYFMYKYPNTKRKVKVMEMYDDFDFKDRFGTAIPTNNCDMATYYLNKFPNARHRQEVMIMYEDCMYRKAQEKPNLDNIQQFLDAFAKSKYAGKVTAIRDSIWRSVKERYSARAEDNATSAAVTRFMQTMLGYLEQKGRHVIFLDLKQETDLKEWKDLTDIQQEQVNTLCKRSFIKVEEGPLPLMTPPPAIKYHYKPSGSKGETIMDNDVQRVLAKHMDSSFGAGVIRLSFFNPKFDGYSYKLTDTAKDDDIVIRINYRVSNKYIPGSGGLPDLYYSTPEKNAYSGSTTRVSSKEGFVMAVKIDWEISIPIPGTALAYHRTMETSDVGKLYYRYSSAYPEIDNEYVRQFTNAVIKDLGIAQRE